MKKLAVLLCAVVGLALLAFAGCSNDQSFTQKTYSSGESTIKSLSVNVVDRQLEFTHSEDDEIRINYFDSQKEYLDISISQGDCLTVNLVTDKEWTDFIGSKPSAEFRKIQIAVPENILISLSASTTNENISVSSLSLGDSLSLNSNGGSVLCERVNVGKSISLTAKNGDISGTILGGWDDFSISCTIKKGNCNLPENKEGGTKSLTVDCNNGNITIDFVK